MLKLYFAPGACSLSPHIALREAGIPFELAKVDFMTGRSLPDGRVLADVTDKNYVPALELEGGQILTEGAVMVQYIADRAPTSGLAPEHGTFARVRLQEWLNFIATERHKGLGPFFHPWASPEIKDAVGKVLAERLRVIDRALADGRTWLTGDTFTVADGYMVYALRAWQLYAKGDIGLFANLGAYWNRLLDRPSVKTALELEGLGVKKAA